MVQDRTFVIFAATPIALLLRLRLRTIERTATFLRSCVLGLCCVVSHLTQLKEVTSTCSRFFLASLTMFSRCLATRSSIQSAPHWLQTVAGTFLTTTTPNSKSAVNVVVPVFLVPAQRGHNFFDFFSIHFFLFVLRRVYYDSCKAETGQREAKPSKDARQSARRGI